MLANHSGRGGMGDAADPVPEYRESDERPFFSRVRVWDEAPDMAAEEVYLEETEGDEP